MLTPAGRERLMSLSTSFAPAPPRGDAVRIAVAAQHQLQGPLVSRDGKSFGLNRGHLDRDHGGVSGAPVPYPLGRDTNGENAHVRHEQLSHAPAGAVWVVR